MEKEKGRKTKRHKLLLWIGCWLVVLLLVQESLLSSLKSSSLVLQVNHRFTSISILSLVISFLVSVYEFWLSKSAHSSSSSPPSSSKTRPLVLSKQISIPC